MQLGGDQWYFTFLLYGALVALYLGNRLAGFGRVRDVVYRRRLFTFLSRETNGAGEEHLQSAAKDRFGDGMATQVVNQQQTALAGLFVFRVGNLVETDLKIVIGEELLEAGRALKRVKVKQREQAAAGFDELPELVQFPAAVRCSRAGDDE